MQPGPRPLPPPPSSPLSIACLPPSDAPPAPPAEPQGIRTLVLTNATGALLAAEQAEGAAHGEHWAHVPDVENFAVTNKSGDYRAALAPLLAAQHFGRGSFRWLLSADDDVAFLWGGLLRMVAPLDADDPYFLSGARCLGAHLFPFPLSMFALTCRSAGLQTQLTNPLPPPLPPPQTRTGAGGTARSSRPTCRPACRSPA